jgi:CHASE3 domain sensor protein
MMTADQGFGMLAVGLVVIAIAGTILYVTINTIENNKIKREQEKKAREKIHGIN